ncbi:hypothetical protein FA379_10520 [Pseudomonas aeruginosa]|nr:hypothetical protein [Pseudomonas aeruginosa]MCO2232520.1 hypothetical protein [Pseudomonas aeruginosa]MCO2238817.1 hypothetical protein [Pseudomonas aeruginosa]MCO2333056.1 hypothetical protein [Pseudomonas aeruginosa]MCO2356328.1 hypothetical protein [Pseudomonas aeruginosa]
MDTLHPFFYTRRPGPAAAPRSPVERDTNFPSLHSEGHGDLRCPFFFSPLTTARRSSPLPRCCVAALTCG